MHHFKSLLFLSVILLVSSLGWTQTNCSDQLRLAQRRYDSGLLDDIPSILEPCLNRGFTKEEKANAYKMLIQTYLFSDLPDKADAMMLRFLREFSNYTILANDHSEFVNLYKTYRTSPIMKIEVALGGNLSLPFIKEFYGLGNLNTTSHEYSPNFGFGFEVNYINKFFNNFDGSVGLSYSFLGIGYWDVPYEFTNVGAKYKNMYLGLPLALRYNKDLFGIDFFVKGGIEPVYLLYSKINFTRTRINYQDDITGTENLIDFQRRFDFRPILSIGANIKVWNADILLTAGVKFGTVMPTKSATRYSNEDLYQKYYFIPDDYLINQVFFNVSYVFSIYNPKKIR